MSYRILVTGIVCFLETPNGYLVAVPDGRDVLDPDGNQIPRHNAYLFIELANIEGLVNWSGDAERGVIALPIDPGSTLEFEAANWIGAIDETQFVQTIYDWRDLDPAFLVNVDAPKNCLTTFPLRRGIIHAYRIPGGEALVVESEISEISHFQPFFDIVMRSAEGVRTVTVRFDTEVVLANVSDRSPDREPSQPQTTTETRDDNHIYIYYQMNEGDQPPGVQLPLQPRNVADSRSRHPFIKGSRDLHVHCSPTLKPATTGSQL